MLKTYIHIHTHSYSRTFMTNDAIRLINGLELEDMNMYYVLCNLTIMYKISYNLIYALISACY